MLCSWNCLCYPACSNNLMFNLHCFWPLEAKNNVQKQHWGISPNKALDVSSFWCQIIFQIWFGLEHFYKGQKTPSNTHLHLAFIFSGKRCDQPFFLGQMTWYLLAPAPAGSDGNMSPGLTPKGLFLFHCCALCWAAIVLAQVFQTHIVQSKLLTSITHEGSTVLIWVQATQH